VILNLKNVRTIDSSGLGEIVAGFSTLRANGGTLVLLNMLSE
jgi:anti-anti-sigma regulatory factor